MEQLRWLWEHWVPLGGLTILDGDPGTGKSILTTQIASWVTKGIRGPLGEPGEVVAANVVMMASEDGLANTVVPRLAAHGADGSKVYFARESEIHHRPLSIPEDATAIAQFCREMKARLLVIDPLTEFISPDFSLNSDQDFRLAFRDIIAVARELDMAVLIVRHMNKQSGERNATYRGAGTIGIIGAARSGLATQKAKKPGDPNTISVIKSNRGKPVPPIAYRIVGGQPAERIEWDLAWEPARTKRPVNIAAEEIKKKLNENPLTVRQLEEAMAHLDLSPATIRRAAFAAGANLHKPPGYTVSIWSLNNGRVKTQAAQQA
jgi:RecA-family ATPase